MPINSWSGSERALVREASVRLSAREQLREAVLAHVIQAAKAFMQSRGISEARESELIEVGMEPFDRVFNIYLKNAHAQNEEEGHFFSYYTWWMRKAIAEYLFEDQHSRQT
ncbi:MAG: hypothetical protein JWN18_170 [Parcubacteria group bacterium]|nr:hypothetical protein [Parcubacteria group bacterium]